MRSRSIGLSCVVLLSAAQAWAQPSLVGDRFLVSSYTTGQQFLPAVCGTPDGGFVVSWGDGGNYYPATDGRDGSRNGAFARRFGPNASPLGAEFQVNTYTTGDQTPLTPVCMGGGEFVVANHNTRFYQGYPLFGLAGREGVFGHAFDSGGARVGAEFRIDDDPQSAYGGPRSSATCTIPGGSEFLVVWSHSYSGSHFAKRYNAAGSAVGPTFSFGGYDTYQVDD